MEQNRVIRSAGIVGGFTLLSRGLGLARDVLMAGFFGTSVYMSAFVVAFTIPNLFRRLFGEGALSASFVPVFVESREKEGDEAAWAMARKVITLTGVVLLLLVLLGIALASLALAAGVFSEKTVLILELLRIMLPYALFICLAALSMGILNSFRHFIVPAATPCLLNIVWILAVLLVCRKLGDSPAAQIRCVAWAVVIAGVIQLGFQLPMLRRHGYQPGLSFDWGAPKVRRMLRLMGPAALGLAVTQFNVVIDRVLAAWIGEWAPAALFYSERLIYFPLGIFATAMSTVLLPTFAGHAARSNDAQMRETLNHSLRNLLFVMIPAAVGLMILARPIVQLPFEWGTFTSESSDLTGIALTFYAPGLLVFSLAKIFVPAFYGMQDTRTPVKIGVLTVFINLVLNLTFVLTWPLYLKHAGLALATVLAEGFYAVALGYVFHRRMGSPGWRKIGISTLRCLAAAGIMVLAVNTAHPWLVKHLSATEMLPKMVQTVAVLSSIGMAVLVYLAAAAVMRCAELKELLGAVRKSA